MSPGNRIAAIDTCKKNRDWQGLVVFLSDEDKGIRRRAAKALGELGNLNALPALMEATGDCDAWVRLDVVRSLGRLRAGVALNVLVTSLKDENIDIRMETLNTLGYMKDKRAIGPLVEALSDSHQEIRSGAAVALERLGWNPSNNTDRALLIMAKKKWTELLALKVFAIESVWEDLMRREEYVRIHAIESLGQTRDDRVAGLLLAGMQDPSRAVRLSAMAAFVRLPLFGAGGFLQALQRG